MSARQEKICRHVAIGRENFLAALNRFSYMLLKIEILWNPLMHLLIQMNSLKGIFSEKLLLIVEI
jgi:hypothetical protein